MLGHPSGPGGPEGALSSSVIDDRVPSIRYVANLGKYHLFPAELATETDLTRGYKPNPLWARMDKLIKHMMGSNSWTALIRTQSAQLGGEALTRRLWSCLLACQLHALDNGATEAPSGILHESLAYTLVAYNLVKLRATILRTTGSYM